MSIDTDDWGYDEHEAISWKAAEGKKWPFFKGLDKGDVRIITRHCDSDVAVWTWGLHTEHRPEWARMVNDYTVMSIPAGAQFDSTVTEWARVPDSYSYMSPKEIEELLRPDELTYKFGEVTVSKGGLTVTYREKRGRSTGETVGEPEVFFTKVKQPKVSPVREFLEDVKKVALQIIGR